LEGVQAKFYFILDSCGPEFASLVSEMIGSEDFIVNEVDKAGNVAAFKLQLDWLQAQSFSGFDFMEYQEYLIN